MADEFDMDIPEPELEFGETTHAPAREDKRPAPAEDALTPEEQRKVDAFVEKIDLDDTTGILNYGVGSQRKVSDFSERALAGVRSRDLGEIGDDITSLIVMLRDFDPKEEDHGFLGLFKKGRSRLEALRARYAEVEENVGQITEILEGHQRTLLKDISMLDQMYAVNEAYFRKLTMYIAAGKQKLAEVRSHELPALQAKAGRSGLAEDAQAVRDLEQKCDRLEKRVYDLQLTRQIALQTAPQIRLIQSSDAVMAEKIQSTVVNTIPLWKNQMVIALGVEHATQAAKAQREVTDMTNELLRKNADRLKMASVETAREAERGVVDVETLKHTNEQLISTLDEVSRVQQEGREKRQQAEEELSQIEGELKRKLIDASDR